MLEEELTPLPEETNSADVTLPVVTPQPIPQEHPRPRGIAPIWHTLLLIAAILAYSFWGAQRITSNNPLAPPHHESTSTKSAAANDDGADPLRILRYALSGGLELLIVGWVSLGLYLRKIPFAALFGKWPRTLNDITKEAAIAMAFWLCSMMVLLTFALVWNAVQTVIYDHQVKIQSHENPATPPGSNSSAKPRSAPVADKPKSPQQEQSENIKELMQLAPSNGLEIAVWAALCLIVGFSEELIFRGYFQSQGITLLRNIPISVILTSLIFGAAHGYQGLRGICLIGVYGALFSIITLLRRNLFPAMLSHAWHDFATGLALALIRTTHILDHLPKSS